MRRFILFVLVALIPVAFLAYLYPERIQTGGHSDIPYLSDPQADITVFYQKESPESHTLKEFLWWEGWTVRYENITTDKGKEKFAALQNRAPNLEIGVPTIVIHNTVLQGFESIDTTGEHIVETYDNCRKSRDGCIQFNEFLASERTVEAQTVGPACVGKECAEATGQYSIDVPFIGEVDLLTYSLPGMALLLGFLDGFNPCAMWVLIVLLALLLGTNDMKKVWILGGEFLLISGAIYFLFIAAWLNVFLAIGTDFWVQKVVGTVAILGASFYLYEAFGRDPNACHVTSHTRRQRITDRMKKSIQKGAWPAMMLGIAAIAISVNFIELLCTAGLPAVFTQIIALNDVGLGRQYFYLSLYILMYMIDDFIIFGIAIYTLQATGLTTKYRRFTLIFGGILMYLLGMLLLFAPEVLDLFEVGGGEHAHGGGVDDPPAIEQQHPHYDEMVDEEHHE